MAEGDVRPGSVPPSLQLDPRTLPFVGFRLRLVGAFTHDAGSGFWDLVTFDTEDYDTNNFVTATSSRFTVPAGFEGFWTLGAQYGHGTNSTGDRGLQIAFNNVDGFFARSLVDASTNVETTLNVSGTRRCIAGDYFEVWPWQNAAATLAKFGDVVFTGTFLGPAPSA